LSDDTGFSGEVVISPQVAAENAAGEGVSAELEIEALLIHGILHLLGYAHDSEDDSEAMFERHEQLAREFAAGEAG
jgi:probable rRNA maturation factor